MGSSYFEVRNTRLYRSVSCASEMRWRFDLARFMVLPGLEGVDDFIAIPFADRWPLRAAELCDEFALCSMPSAAMGSRSATSYPAGGPAQCWRSLRPRELDRRVTP